MNFLQMKYFIAVAEERSFSAATKRLFISQQNLSAQIAQMEEEYRLRLFHRTRPLMLTAAGEQFYLRCQQLLNLQEQIDRELHGLSHSRQGLLRVGISYAYARALLPGLLLQFQAEMPEVEVHIYENDIQELSQQLLQYKLDFIFSRPPYPPEFVCLPVERDNLFLYAPELSLRRVYGPRTPEIQACLAQSGNLGCLESCPFILARNGSVRAYALELLSLHQIRHPVITLETGSLETALVLCREGLGVSIAPPSLLAPYQQDPDAPELSGIYRISHSGIWPELSLCYRRQSFLPRAMEGFLNVVKSYRPPLA